MRGGSPQRSGRRRRIVALAPAALAALAAVAGCGKEPAEPAAVGKLRAGSVAALADCADWRGGTGDERLATIAEVRSQVMPAAGGATEPALSVVDAYEFLERACALEYAATFRLYKLYNRGASFSRLDR